MHIGKLPVVGSGAWGLVHGVWCIRSGASGLMHPFDILQCSRLLSGSRYQYLVAVGTNI